MVWWVVYPKPIKIRFFFVFKGIVSCFRSFFSLHHIKSSSGANPSLPFTTWSLSSLLSSFLVFCGLIVLYSFNIDLRSFATEEFNPHQPFRPWYVLNTQALLVFTYSSWSNWSFSALLDVVVPWMVLSIEFGPLHDLWVVFNFIYVVLMKFRVHARDLFTPYMKKVGFWTFKKLGF